MEDIELLFNRAYPQMSLLEVKSQADLKEIDVLLAGGGPDINPTLYGEVNQHCNSLFPKRDARDYDLLAQTLQSRIPFLGLCRGAQLLNVVLGGTLYQDLEAQRATPHTDPHPVHFSGLGTLHLGEVAEVNSTHHQGVKILAPGLTLIGQAPDGLPEAWHAPGAIGVQFHPETLVHDDSHWLNLFQWWLDGAA